MSIGDAVAKLFERVPVAEANFFGIVIAIQQKAGGNLSEALGNLSRVLRDRRRWRGKIKAMSMEAKASAAIIGCLPFTVGILAYLSSPTTSSSCGRRRPARSRSSSPACGWRPASS